MPSACVVALQACNKADSTEARKSAAADFAKLCTMENIFSDDLMTKLLSRFTNTKNAGVREAALWAFGAMCSALGGESEPFTLPGLAITLDLCADKVTPVRDAANATALEYCNALNPNSVRMVLPTLFNSMKPAKKWQTNLAGVLMTNAVVRNSPGPAAKCLPEIMPVLVGMMWDPNKHVKKASCDGIAEICATIENKDIQPFIPALISAMENPEEVEECVHKLGSTTFVQTVDAPALAITVPLLLRGFREKKTATKRTCAVIVDNMAKLVEVPRDASVFLPKLKPELEGCMENIADPECRQICERAYKTLMKIQDAMVDLDALSADAMLKIMTPLLGGVDLSESNQTSLEYVSNMAASMVETLNWEPLEWNEGCFYTCLPFLSKEKNSELTAALIAYGTSHVVVEEEDEDADDDAEELCNCKFSLAYGTKILLNSTGLKLKRGRAYGLLGPNDCGKSTLMRSIANEQVDGFPPRDEVRTVYVESDIQGDMIDLPCNEFILFDTQIQDFFGNPGSKVYRDVHTGDAFFDAKIEVTDKYAPALAEIEKVMLLIGFTDKMLTDPANTLSGGWRMKLALAKAMIQRADIMLMDEPTNHLDVVNVAWVTDYISSLKGVTCIIVSHDATLLDKCCSYIINFEENLKLKLYKGNLTEFIIKVPEAKCYFELKSDKVKFNFPQPGLLEGINTKGRKIMEMQDVTFTYPCNTVPTVRNISVRCSLSSRVACIGRNGAGKSTIIKLLTGEMEPSSGKVWKHPNCRVAYVAQHAFHHIEQHLEKTPNQYILWRYQGGDDKETLAKSTVKSTEAELKVMKKPVEIKWTDEDGKSHKESRVVEKLSGGRKQGKSKSYEYEVKWENRPAGANSFMKMDQLVEMGWEKAIKEVDEKIATQAGAYARPLTQTNVEKHLQDIGMDKEYGTHSRMAALSGGQKVKVVIAGSMWMQPHIVILDEPTNYLDRESLGALADAIKVFDGGVVIISHNAQFCSQLCPETWVLEKGDDGIGQLDVKGDAEWMKSVMKQKVEVAQIGDQLDAYGNTVEKKKKKKKTLSRKEKKQKARLRKLRQQAGEAISEDSDDY